VCLIALAVDMPGPWLLAIAANRDEFHDRQAAPAAYWGADADAVLAGKDLQAGGTWLGLRRAADDSSLRIAALTNLRPGLMPAAAPLPALPTPPSRGGLVAGFLSGATGPAAFLQELAPAAGTYAGFNLLAVQVQDPGTQADAWYLNNLPESRPLRLEPGLHVVSNATLAVEWPKTRRLREAMSGLLAAHGRNARRSAASVGRGTSLAGTGASVGAGTPSAGEADADQALAEALLGALSDRTPAPDSDLPSTGLDRRRERLLSAPFIVDDHYGTRCSTVLLVARDGGVFFSERSFGPGGRLSGTVVHRFTRSPMDGPRRPPLP
jgi:uncharacterized protein with NRDE domain